MNFIKEVFNFINKYGTIAMGIIVIFWFIFGIIAVLVYKKRKGHFPKCQEYGRN